MINRFDYTANQGNLVDTYVPLPFLEMREGLQAKQQEYDTQKLTLDTADKQVKGILPNVSETFKDTKGNDVINPHYSKIKQYNDYLDQQRDEIFNKYKNDLTSSDAKNEISNFARTAANVYNEVAPDALNTETNYKESKKRLDEMKGEDQAHRKLEFDQNLYKLGDRQTKKLDTSNVIDEHKFEDLDKNFLEGFKADVTDRVGTYINKGLLSKVDYGNKVKELTEKEISNRYDSFYKTNHLPIVENNANYDIEHIYRKQKSRDPELTKEKFNKSKSITLANGKSYTPDEYKNLYIQDDKQRRLDQAKRYAFKEEDKSQSSSFLPGVKYGSDGEVIPTFDERSTQLGGENTGNQQIDFKEVKNPYDVARISGKYNPKFDYARDNKVKDIIGWSNAPKTVYKGSFGEDNIYNNTPENALSFIKKELEKKSLSSNERSILERDRRSVEPLVKEREAFKKLGDEARKGDINSIHKFYEETNPVYKNVSDAYKSKFGKTILDKNDIKNIQSRANQNLQTVQGNQEVTLNPKYDAESLQNVAGSVLNGNAIVKNSKGEVINPKDIIPDYGDKSPEQIIKYLQGGITTYVTPIGKREASYKATLNGENYNITYPNSVAVPELRKYKETTANIYDVNLPANQEVDAPSNIQQAVLKALDRNNIIPTNIKYISSRDDWNIDNSTVNAEITYNDPKTQEQKTTIMKIPVFGGKTSVTGMATNINPQTGMYQDMLKYTIKDSESNKNIPVEE